MIYLMKLSLPIYIFGGTPDNNIGVQKMIDIVESFIFRAPYS